jgi:hypothetical protein
MASVAASPRRASGSKRAGWAVSGLAAAFLLMDGGMKLLPFDVVGETLRGMGWPTGVGLIRLLGIIQIGSAILYLLPRTALFGAVMLTGYLGGAVASHVRIDSPLFTHILFGVYLGALMWVGLVLREPRIRTLLLG